MRQGAVIRVSSRKPVALERVSKLQAGKAKDLNTLDEILDDAFASVDQDSKLMTKADVLLQCPNDQFA
jgi:hypothetical protein